ncbi:MAG: Gfo/Idh/MocA family oxidoreductase, partial [Nitrospirales bacterium]|nr:Gfo/Idh/MocA family oxidoreductase [Nitrospirales bacterium]
MINCAIIGFGKMGRIRARAIEKSGKGRIVGLHDINPPVGCSYPIVNSYEKLIESQEVGAVFVCTPNAYISDLCVKALKAGKHVFSEKPPGIHAHQVEDV